jgi:geranylgeranyl pyrophosphate synthase
VSKDQWRQIVALLREHRTTDLAYAKATEYASRAKASLDVFPPSRERDALKALADFVLARDR